MTESFSSLRLNFDLKTERTLLATRKGHMISENVSIPTKQMINMNHRTFKKLVAVNVSYLSLCINYLIDDASFELKFELIHLLPRFHGLAGKDPYKFLKEFWFAQP